MCSFQISVMLCFLLLPHHQPQAFKVHILPFIHAFHSPCVISYADVVVSAARGNDNVCLPRAEMIMCVVTPAARRLRREGEGAAGRHRAGPHAAAVVPVPARCASPAVRRRRHAPEAAHGGWRRQDAGTARAGGPRTPQQPPTGWRPRRRPAPRALQQPRRRSPGAARR
jgi:hypothetical protein